MSTYNHILFNDVADFFASKLPSAIEKIDCEIYANADVEVYIKRDDLIDSVISGNKWRKLKYTLLDCIQNGKNHILTFGGAYSNHLPAVAKVCNSWGLKSTAFVRGEELSANSNIHLQYCNSQVMELIFIERILYKNKKTLVSQYYKDESNIYIVDEGGRGFLGAKGCGDIINELECTFDHIFVCVGTGTTLAGIANAAAIKFAKTIINGIVVLKGAEEIENEVKEMTTQNNWVLHHQFHGGGYGKTYPELDSFIEHYKKKTNIPCELVYTGKMFYAIDQLIKVGYIKKGQKVLAIHTGGFEI
ncbi:MAG: pyridoxal-phosphate dependent enzyme [Bacteroidota bacterium]|nr:pyridoxal-phosphate dependent enzyme [Bacteroidota bacterium]